MRCLNLDLTVILKFLTQVVSTLTASSGKYYFGVASGTTITDVANQGLDRKVLTNQLSEATGSSYIYNFGDGRVYGPSGGSA